MRAERLLIVALQKCGTHLVQELAVSSGYSIVGESRIAPDIRPVLDASDRRRILAAAGGKPLELLADMPVVGSATARRLWETVKWNQLDRLGIPTVNRYSVEVADRARRGLGTRRLRHASFIDATPHDVAWITHEPAISGFDGQFLTNWARLGEPRFIFQYRDPRAAISSFVGYLLNETGRGFGSFAEFTAYSAILQSLPDFESRARYLIRDDGFPGLRTFRDGVWLLNHPSVCKLSYEELVGPEGGGSSEAQLSAVDRYLIHIASDQSAESLAAKVYNRNAFTFNTGKSSSWLTRWSDSLDREFRSRHEDLLEQYGYI